ncbi:S-layer protein [Bacillus sp. REN10]|uniref:S-layer protein n=1 Tax=Bacillus sp. REN10 TaxID=2782541 RepID=UPI00193B5AA7|nr:S-layer protein [Bacillus sp. REN10]
MAINGKQLLVKFNKEVNKNSAETDANYLLKKNGVAAPLTATTDYTTKVQEDGKSVLITLTTPIQKTESAVFTVTVEDILVKGSLTDKFPVYTTTVTVHDTVAPTITEVSAKTAGAEADSVTIKFSEPVAQPTVKVNGTTKSVKLAADGLSGTIENLSLETGKTHSIEAINLTDLSGNVTGSTTKTFEVTKDTAAPAYSISTVSDGQIKLTFDKKMDVDSVVSGVLLKKEDLNDLATSAYAVTESTVASEKGKVFYVDIDKSVFDPYTSKKSYSFTVMTKNTVKDSLGNKMAATSQVVKLTKDEVEPKLQSVEYIKNSKGEVTTLLLKYDEVLKAAPTTITGLTAKNVTTGAVVDILGTTPTASLLDDKKTVRINIDKTTAAVVKSGKLEVSVAAGYVTDIALTGNESKTQKLVVDFGAGAASELKVNVASVAKSNQIVATFDDEVTYASATNPANYSVNGLALPADTTITFDTATKKEVAITLPAEFIKEDDAGAVFRVQNVATPSGTQVSVNQTVVSVADNAGPVIVKAKSSLNTNGTLTLGFDEKVAPIDATLTSDLALADLKLSLNGELVTIATPAQVEIGNGAGADAGKYVITFNNNLDKSAGTAGNAETVTVYFDVNGNATFDADKDILVKKHTGLTVAERDAITAGSLDLNKVSSITVGTKDATANIVDKSDAQNKILKKQSVVIK